MIANLFKTTCILVIFLTSIGSFGQTVYSVPPKDVVDLSDWKPVKSENKNLWKVIDGMVIGGDGLSNVPTNTYLCSTKTYEDFELRCLFRLSGNPDSGGMINSGIQYRSSIIEGKMVGYQADIGNGYWGDIYDEHRRAKLVGGDVGSLKSLLKVDGWNSYIVRVKGNKHELYINGIKTCEYIEKDSSIPTKGIIGFQLHKGGNAMVEFINITITEL
ncbi:DUF1080 domain-containing protein [Arenibacter sp. ARW7G5Y1]|uniref:3-keto-disaccharide hydrolase n=1 Tax=Arenibacter sp. ARW7G5Y1 TaxID=2135619 RepID=UPI000D75CB55|nr:DUF1080 domain-containing protein [Arenibacter sp. ARW7G5Y1]PXX21490.1 uncharacterized protein DUF1080 [Arenibacter sp. ARW7G5Y1]